MAKDESALRDREIPRPSHPLRRHAPLPGSHPKSGAEDPEARLRVERLVESPAYREGSEDPDFLRSGAARGVRLDLDYLKPELQLQSHAVTDAIVVFGSRAIRATGRAHPREVPLLRGRAPVWGARGRSSGASRRRKARDRDRRGAGSDGGG